MRANTHLILSFLTLLTFFVLSGEAREPVKEFYLMGAGGDPAGEKTIFDTDLKAFGKFATQSGWRTTISLDGGHRKTEDMIRRSFSEANNKGPFTKSNYEALINEALNKIESGQLSSGDQLMIAIDTHGAKRKNEKTHAIALSGAEAKDLVTLEGADTVNLDALEKLAEEASKKGVKLAIMDLSCYSGSLLNIKNDKVCMISASSPDFPSYVSAVGFFGRLTTSFADAMTDSLRKGRNLEDLFLMSLEGAENRSSDFPMISTPEGQAVHALLYERLRPFLYNNLKIFDMQFNKLYSDKANIENTICSLNKNFEELKTIFEHAANATNISDQIDDFRNLNKYLEEYRAFQKSYERALFIGKEMNVEFHKNIATEYASESERLKDVDAVTYLNKDHQEVEDALFTNNPMADDPIYKRIKRELETDKKIKSDLLARLNPAQLEALKIIKSAEERTSEAWRFASQVASETKKVFVQIYKQNRKAASNPCRDFVL